MPRKSLRTGLSVHSGAFNKASLELADAPVTAEKLGGMIARIVDNTINGKIAKQVFGFMWEEGKTADQVIAERLETGN